MICHVYEVRYKGIFFNGREMVVETPGFEPCATLSFILSYKVFLCTENLEEASEIVNSLVLTAYIAETLSLLSQDFLGPLKL